MGKGRLLERMRMLESNPASRFSEESREDRIASIREHLQHLLNTRQGSASIAEQYGVPDLTDLPGALSGNRVGEIQRNLQRVIERFEPRLARARVSYEWTTDGPGKLRFSITGRLAGDEEGEAHVFSALVDPGGQVSIDG